jgi:metallo-beta-lactamase family protein
MYSDSPMATLTFLGAARTVTGSKYLLHIDGQHLLVDCGLFQGLKELRERNWAQLPVHPASIHAVVLTHAHIDHSGWLPRLVANGFRGPIYCTPGTADLCSLVLPDAGHLQEEDARYANRGRFTKHSPALPLFTEADAHQALSQIHRIEFDRKTAVSPSVQVEYMNAGHLLGSAFVRMTRVDGKGGTVLFGGDLGRYGRPVLPDPKPGVEADVLLVESTYGDRIHPDDDDGEGLAAIVKETIAAKGKLIIPAFAIGRVEEVLYWLRRLEQAGRIPQVPVFVDSPMAVKALNYYRSHALELDPDSRPGASEASAFATARFEPVETARQSKEVTAMSGPAIVISASGMATGGRVLHHLADGLPDPRNTVLFVGFQAAGTRGRQLVDGIAEVKIHGRFIAVQARIRKIDGMSAHADAGEIVRWLRTFPRAPKMTYLVHGEPAAQAALQTRIGAELKWPTLIPQHGQKVDLPL